MCPRRWMGGEVKEDRRRGRVGSFLVEFSIYYFFLLLAWLVEGNVFFCFYAYFKTTSFDERGND